MSDFASEAHIEQYTARTAHLLQQQGSKLMMGVTTMGFQGKAAQVVQQYGAIEAQAITSRHANTVLSSTPQTSRWIRPSDWGVADMVDREDLLRSLTDPKSDFARAQAMGMGRKQDDIILDGIFGVNYTGEGGATSVTATADGVLAEPAGGTGLTLAKLKTIRRNFQAAEVDLDREPLYMAITSAEVEGLFTISEYINGESFNNAKPLTDGRLRPFMGINFLVTERLPVDGAGATRCPVWVKRGVVFGSWGGLMTSVDKRADKWGNVQVMTKGTFGATRTEGELVQEVLCVVS